MKMSVERESFGIMPDGKEVFKYIITNNNEISAEILTLGATLCTFYAEDKNGELRDVLLGFDTLEEYLEKWDYQGATVGPVCNRIGGATINVGEKRYEVTANENGDTCLHSGGLFTNAVWNAIVTDADSVEFSLTVPDGSNGFPGEIKASVTYRLDDKNALHIKYDAVSTRDTYLNFTNHAYFNLDGVSDGDILGHSLMIDSDGLTAVDEKSIPTGEILPLEGTPFDFTSPRKIGLSINDADRQLELTGGYDHNFSIKGYNGKLKKCCEAEAAESGIKMNVYTDLPGVQFYAGNFLKGVPGKNGIPMNKRGGFCLETQYFPDCMHHENFINCLFKAGEHYRSETVYEFSL